MAQPIEQDSFISRGVQRYRSLVPSPAVQAFLLGGAAMGLSSLAWKPVVETARSLGRVPGRAISRMSNAEWDEALDEIRDDPKYRRWLPVALGGAAGLAALGLSYAPNREYGGLLNWEAPVKTNPKQALGSRLSYLQHTPAFTKGAGLKKRANDLFEYTGYVPTLDLSDTINARSATSLFTNDPFLQNDDYVRNLGTSIVTNAAIQQHSNTPTLGSVFDSAVDKIDKKLSFSGLADVGVKSVISNATARLFTDVVGTMTNLTPDTRRNLVDAGTWAGTITSILT